MNTLALLMFFVASWYLILNSGACFGKQKAIYVSHTAGILLHMIGAMLTIVIDPFQFLPQRITRPYKLHRWLGKTYMMGVMRIS